MTNNYIDLVSEEDADYITYWFFNSILRHYLPDHITQDSFYNWISAFLTKKEAAPLKDAIEYDQYDVVLYYLISNGFEEYGDGGELQIPKKKKDMLYAAILDNFQPHRDTDFERI